MGLENATNINSLNENNPLGTDSRSQGDDHIRMIKSVLKSDVFAASLANGSTGKATPVDADLLLIADSAASYGRKKLTWANLKATVKAYFDTLYAKVGAITASGLTQSTGKLLGRTSSGNGQIEELNVVGPLALTGGALTTSMNTGKLLGRTTAETGAVEEISVGSRLVLSNGVLDVSESASLIYDPVGLVQVQTGGGAGFYQRVDENFNPLPFGREAFTSHATYRGIVEQIIDVQWMVKIPKFWFRAGTVPSGTYAGKAYWMISPVAKTGFSVHPAFIGAGGVELAQIWVGKYQASSSGGKLQSVPGVLPRVSMNFPTARTEAYARNTGGVSGFRLWSYYDLAAIQMLATIEMGGLDMQALIGRGCVSASSTANVDAADVAQATWRGIVGLWGNVWQMVDGVKRNGGNWWRWQYNAPGNTATSDFATGYVNTGRAAPTSSGYPVTFDTTLLSAGIIVPATVDGTASNGSTGDYYYSNTSTDDRIAYHGGSWGTGGYAGLFYLDATLAPSYADSYIGCRLAKV